MLKQRFQGNVVSIAAFWILTAPAHAQVGPQVVFDEILDLFRSHDVVLLGEQHDAKLNFEFRMGLLRSPRFAETVQDIVIECGNSLYQELLDDFVVELRDVPIQDLQKVWRNTTMPTGVWDPPIYEEFIRAVREVNVSRRPGERIRLLAGDPPIDWTAVTTGDEFMEFLDQRDQTPFEIVEREVIGRGRKALVIYGGSHLVRGEQRQTIASLLEEKYAGRTFALIPWSSRYMSVEEFEGLTGVRQGPALLRLENTDLGDVLAREVFPFLGDYPLGTMMDAILYLGPALDETVEITPEVLEDAAYQDELKRRMDILSRIGGPAPELRPGEQGMGISRTL